MNTLCRISDTAKPGITPAIPMGTNSSIYNPPHPSNNPTLPRVVLIMSSNFGAHNGSSNFRYLKLECLSINSLMNPTLIDEPPGLKSCINTGVPGIDCTKADKYSIKEFSGKLKIRGTANDITSAPASTFACASLIAIFRDG